jgi:predicted Zn finger-like uncharacterized protein
MFVADRANMATPPTETLAVTCPKCGARFRLAGEMAGRKGRCAKCGDVFRVPAASPVGGLSEADSASRNKRQSASETPPTIKPKTEPKPIAVSCRVCQTLMYGRRDQVGKQIKCPDCGAQNVVPPPPVEKVKKQPAAIEGDQYEVWGVDEAPPLAEIIAAQPKYIAVLCRMCQTLMHATPEQVGRKLKCPDCGTLTVIEPPEESVKKPAAANDEYELEIDPTLDPGERPHVIVPPRRPMLYEEEAEAARKKAEERAAHGGHRGPKYDERGRAVMPRYPLASRVLSFMFTSGVIRRWAALTLTWYILVSPTWLTSLTMMGPIAAVPMGIMSFICILVWFAGLAAIVLSIIVESSEGNDEIHSWPSTNPADWIGEFFYLVFASFVSPLPGWLLGRFIPDPATQITLFIGSIYFALPVIILSQLEVGSAFAVASPRVIGSIFRVPGSWLMFYVEIGIVGLVCLGATFVAALAGSVFVAGLVPLYIAAIVMCARILGRLAWKISESVPGRDDDEKEASAAA